jgi:hypothetical protein
MADNELGCRVVASPYERLRMMLHVSPASIPEN